MDGARTGSISPSLDRATEPQPISQSPGAPSGHTASDSQTDFLFHLYRGSELLRDDRVHEAKDELEAAIALEPDDRKVQEYLAATHFRLREYKKAIALYERLREFTPRDPLLLLNAALCYLKTGQAALARRDLEMLVADEPSNTRAWGYLGIARKMSGEMASAQQAFEHGGQEELARRIDSRITSELPDRPSHEDHDVEPLRFELDVPGIDVDDPSLHGHRRRNTLAIGIASESDDALATLKRLPNPPAPSYDIDHSGTPSLRHPGVAMPAAYAPYVPQSAHGPSRTLHPVVAPPPPVAKLTRDSEAAFAAAGRVVIQAGTALISSAAPSGFVARLEAIRACSNALTMKHLERQVKGHPTGEALGGASSPFVHARGEGPLILAPRAGRKLASFALGDEDPMCFMREDILLGFDGSLSFENGKIATGDGEFLAIVQVRGSGAVLLETLGEILSLAVEGNRGLSIRREAVLGWFGRLVPRVLVPGEAPCGQHGLVSFAGDGRILVTST